MLVKNRSELSDKAGIHVGDVVVALDGQLTETLEQYTWTRGLTDSPELDLIIYRDGTYLPIHARVPERRFNIDLQTLHP